jgi:hypothetical protein
MQLVARLQKTIQKLGQCLVVDKDLLVMFRELPCGR